MSLFIISFDANKQKMEAISKDSIDLNKKSCNPLKVELIIVLNILFTITDDYSSGCVDLIKTFTTIISMTLMLSSNKLMLIECEGLTPVLCF